MEEDCKDYEDQIKVVGAEASLLPVQEEEGV